MTFWMYWLRKKNIANIAAGARNIATKLAARVRFRKTRDGSSGCSTRLSMNRKTARSTTPATRLAIVQASPQPSAAGPAEAVDEAEQAEGAGDGAGEVELSPGGDSDSSRKRGASSAARCRSGC